MSLMMMSSRLVATGPDRYPSVRFKASLSASWILMVAFSAPFCAPLQVAAAAQPFAVYRTTTLATDTAGTRIFPEHPGREYNSALIADGDGGAFVGFEYVPGLHFVARLDAAGQLAADWQPAVFGGINVQELRADVQVGLARARPGAVWAISDDAGTGVLLYRKVVSGGLASPDTSAAGTQWYASPATVPSSGGNVLTIGRQNTARTTVGLAVGVIRPSGSLEEPGIVVNMPGNGNSTFSPALRAAPDGVGGAFAVQEVSTVGDGSGEDLALVHFDAAGLPTWTPAVRTVVAARDQSEAGLVCDGSGGAWMVWTDGRDPLKGADVYLLHVLADGSLAPGWPAFGRALASFAGEQARPRIVSDGAGGFWASWRDSRTGVNDIYVTHVVASGSTAPGFPTGGRPLCAAAGSQIDVELGEDGSGGVLAAWLDERNGNLDVYAQHLDATGQVVPGWQLDGLPVCTHASPASFLRLATVSPGHAIAAWNDARMGTPQVYAAALPEDAPTASAPPLRPSTLALAPAVNPSHGSLEVLLAAGTPRTVQLDVYDVTGRVLNTMRMRASTGTQRVTIGLHGARTWPPGLYLVRAASGDDAVVCRVVLAR